MELATSSLSVGVLLFVFICVLCGTEASPRKRKKREQGVRSEYALNPEITLPNVKQEFGHEFGGFAEPMLCSACKLTARLWNDELGRRPEVNSTDDEESFLTLKAVFSSTCKHMPDPLIGVPGASGPEFQAFDDVARVDKDLAEKAKANAKSARMVASRLCNAVLFSLRVELISEISTLTQSGLPVRRNWERLMCGRLARLCKMQGLADDDDISDGQVTDSVEKRAESEAQRQDMLTKRGMFELMAASMSGKKAQAKILLKEMKKQGINVPSFMVSLVGSDEDADSGNDYDPDLDDDL